MLIKTKLFSSQFVVEREEDGSWSVLNKTDDIDDQINMWVETTRNLIVNTSAPSMHAEWLDAEHKRKTIIVSLMVMYTTEETGDVEYPEFREPSPVSE
jgi:hypothetical protein